MAANTNPIFTLTPKISGSPISVANTGRDGTGTLGTIISGSTNGTRISRVIVQASGSVSAGTVRLFVYDGSDNFLYKEIAVTSSGVSGSTPAFSYALELFGERALVLPSGYSLKASTNNGENFYVIAEGGDY